MRNTTDEPSFDRFGRSLRIGTCRSRIKSLDVIGDRRAMRRAVRQQCPATSGVYGWIDSAGELIYVGKAKSLRDRLLSYFAAGVDEQKSVRIGGRAVRLVWERVSHEFAALVRELELIRRFRPRCNVEGQPGRLRRGFLCIGRDSAPRAYLTPTVTLAAQAVYGPLLIGRRMRRAVERLNTVFGLRDCRDDTPMHYADEALKRGEVSDALCPRHDLGLCLGPCAARCDRVQYQAAVDAAIGMIESRDHSQLDRLAAEMQRSSEQRHFERASLMRDTLRDLRMVQQQVAHMASVQSWAFVYCPPAQSGRRTWYYIRRGLPVAAIREPQSVEQAQRALALVDKWLGVENDTRHVIDRETLPFVVLVAKWFHFHPGEQAHRLDPVAVRERCRQLIAQAQAA